MKKIRPPAFLKERGKKFFNKVIAEFVFENAHEVELLGSAGGELDSQFESQKAIDTDGAYITNRYGKKVEHPAVKSLRDSRALFMRLVREMGLDLTTGPESRQPRKY
jgi:phage terminase small subunit